MTYLWYIGMILTETFLQYGLKAASSDYGILECPLSSVLIQFQYDGVSKLLKWSDMDVIITMNSAILSSSHGLIPVALSTHGS